MHGFYFIFSFEREGKAEREREGEREEERERHRFALPLFMHSLVDSRTCPDLGSNPKVVPG